MRITATSERSPQSIAAWRVPNGSYWWEIRVVAWISQNTKDLRTTVYFKWQVGSFNYWPYWNDTHTYTVSIGGQSQSTSFNLPQDRSNTYKDKSSVQSITVSHSTDGTYSGTISFKGYKCWEAFNYSEGLTLPTITVAQPEPSPEPEPTPEPEPEPEIPVPVINDLDPRFYILADGKVIYSNNDPEYYLINPKLKLELNKTDSLDFTIPPGNAMYNSISKLKTTIEVRQGSEILFRGRALDDSIDFNNRKTVHCEGALSFLGDTLMNPYTKETYKTADLIFKAALDQHVGQVPSATPQRRLKYVTSNVSTTIEMENSDYSYTSDIITKLINDVGGYLKLEYYDNGETGLSYLNSYNRTSSQIISFGENLLDLSQKVEATDVYTSVICFGKKDEQTGVRISTGFVEDNDAINTYGRIIRYFTYDDVETVEELNKLAEYQLLLGIRQTITFEIKAIDLHIINPKTEKIRVGDSVKIISRPHNADSYFQCSMIDMDLQNPDNTNYTFGATVKSLTDTTSKK